MKAAIYARSLRKSGSAITNHFFDLLEQYQFQYIIYDQFLEELKATHQFQLSSIEAFNEADDLKDLGIDILISLGGDGTLLDTLNLVKDSNIPVMGINMGRLGFLANVPSYNIDSALASVYNGQYTREPRGLLQLSTDEPLFHDQPYALNDLVVQKRDFSSLVTVETYLDGEYFNTYWADGLIIATPTGSTGYSLSCGGPIMFPGSDSLVVTPVAPHNLNIRPITISDEANVTLKVAGRDNSFLASLDSRYTSIRDQKELTVTKAPFHFNLIKLNHQSFIKTIRDKLRWGDDPRNE